MNNKWGNVRLTSAVIKYIGVHNCEREILSFPGNRQQFVMHEVPFASPWKLRSDWRKCRSEAGPRSCTPCGWSSVRSIRHAKLFARMFSWSNSADQVQNNRKSKASKKMAANQVHRRQEKIKTPLLLMFSWIDITARFHSSCRVKFSPMDFL